MKSYHSLYETILFLKVNKLHLTIFSYIGWTKFVQHFFTRFYEFTLPGVIILWTICIALQSKTLESYEFVVLWQIFFKKTLDICFLLKLRKLAKYIIYYI